MVRADRSATRHFARFRRAAGCRHLCVGCTILFWAKLRLHGVARLRAASKLLRLWWHLDMAPYSTAHDYEQRALYWVLAHLRAYRGRGELLRQLPNLRPMAINASLDGSPVVHVDHTRRGERLWRLGLAILAADPRASRSLPMPPWQAAPLLQTGVGETAANGEELRHALLNAALAVARTHQPEEEEESSFEQLRKAAAEAFSSLFQSGRQRRKRRERVNQRKQHERRSKLVARAVNASEAAERLLPPLPADFDLPSGLPLALRPCDAPHLQQWQTWRHGANAALSLVAYPRLCLSAGPSTPLRSELSTSLLAQLQPCNTVPDEQRARAERIGTDAAWQLFTPLSGSAAAKTVDSTPLTDPGWVPTAIGTQAATSASNDPIASKRLLTALQRLASERGGKVALDPRVSMAEPEAAAAAAAVPSLNDDGRFAGKHGQWRKAHADPSRLFTPCKSTADGSTHDKAVEDCEAWCRPKLRRKHCSKCKCRACRECGGGDASSTSSAALGDGRTSGLCLGVWRNDPLDGAPLLFAPCGGGSWQQRRQQRWTLQQVGDDGVKLRLESARGLCVTAHPVHHL